MISALRHDAGWRLRPGRGATIATLLAFVVLIALGTWQVQRLAWKEALIAHRTAQLADPPTALPDRVADWRALDFRRIEVSGVLRHDLEQLFGLSTHQQQAGHHLLTPLVRPDGSALLIDRGWLPLDRVAPETRRQSQISGPITISGIARYRADDQAGWMVPENQPAEALWFRYDLDAMAAALGLDLLPIVLEADATPVPGGVPIGGRTRIELANNHLQYAVTWYGLAAALLAVYIAYSIKRGRMSS